MIRDYGMEQIIVCTDAGLSSKANRKFNDKIIDGIQIRSFITTQSVKQLPEYLKEFALDPEGWHLPGSSETFCLDEIDEEADYHKVFYKDRWIKEDLSPKKNKKWGKAFGTASDRLFFLQSIKAIKERYGKARSIGHRS